MSEKLKHYLKLNDDLSQLIFLKHRRLLAPVLVNEIIHRLPELLVAQPLHISRRPPILALRPPEHRLRPHPYLPPQFLRLRPLKPLYLLHRPLNHFRHVIARWHLHRHVVALRRRRRPPNRPLGAARLFPRRRRRRLAAVLRRLAVPDVAVVEAGGGGVAPAEVEEEQDDDGVSDEESDAVVEKVGGDPGGVGRRRRGGRRHARGGPGDEAEEGHELENLAGAGDFAEEIVGGGGPVLF
ncbi:protein kinase superfamily protein [Striga asiatica]|uniref:Protein kinase superfamily protein n=1 Tax=Striga asiatica TaxID=4170 RepID=A0A5A7PS13_STRAF|nr:protein kinase superfamily protein [Striga asiatica]